MEIPLPEGDFHDAIPMPAEFGCEPPPPGVDDGKTEKIPLKIEVSEQTRLHARELIQRKLTQLKQKAREEEERLELSRARQRSAEREAENMSESDRIIDQLFKSIKERENETIKQGEEHIAQLNADMEKINEELARLENEQKAKIDEDDAVLDSLYDDIFGVKKKKKKKDKKKHKEKKHKKNKDDSDKDPELDPNFFNVPSPTSLAKSFLELEEIDNPALKQEVDKEITGEKPKSRSRSRSHDRKRSRDKSRNRSLSRKHSRSRSRDHKSSRSQEKRSRSRDRRSRSRDRKRSRSRDRKRSRSRDRRSRSRDRRSRSRDRKRSRSRDCKRSRSRDRKRSRSYDRRSHSRSRRSRSRSRGRDRRSRSRERSSRSSYRESYKSSSSHYTSYRGGIRDARERIRDRRERHRTRSRSRSRSRDRQRKRKEDDLFYIDKEKLRQIAIKRVKQMEAAGKSIYSLGGITSEDIAQIKSGGASLGEVTAFCKSLARNKTGDDSSSSDESEDVNVPIENDDSAGTLAAQFVAPKLAPIKMNIKNAKQIPVIPPEEKSKLRSSFPVSSGTHHRKDEPNEWTPVPASESQKPVFDDKSDESDTDIGVLIAKRLKAVKKLKQNPADTETKATVAKLDEKALRWGQKSNLPGEFTGRVETKFLTPDELAPSEDKKRQAWIRKDIFHRAAPVQGGIGKHLLMRMGWKEGEGLGIANHGSLEPLVLDFNTTRKGLQAPEEKAKTAALAAVAMGPVGVARSKSFKTFDLSDKNPISALMEICSKRKWDPPKWETIHESGPSHKKTFLIQVTVNGVTYQPSIASNNKKVAKAQSATTALQAMGLVPRNEPAAVVTIPNPANPVRKPVQPPPQLLRSVPSTASTPGPRPQPVQPANYKKPTQKIPITAVPTHLPTHRMQLADAGNPVMFDDSQQPRQSLMNNIDLSSFR